MHCDTKKVSIQRYSKAWNLLEIEKWQFSDFDKIFR